MNNTSINTSPQFYARARGAMHLCIIAMGIFAEIVLAELSLALWLLIKGVNIAKWKESTA
jgi:hypothetical protein